MPLCDIIMWNGIYLYLDGQAVGVYDTLFEAESAMGIHTNSEHATSTQRT
ncbi:MAG: hypothetical protein K5876_08310 [Ruminiclostridium sp.]|nr:hypothetical protein [Ruminiclostridium sp.]